MDNIFRDLQPLEIQRRDRWQFEQKSEYFPPSKENMAYFLQEFYIFVPNSLNINTNSYNKTQFYRDLTTYIRYKTPVYSIHALCTYSDLLNLLQKLKSDPDTTKDEDALMILANIIRSAIREETKICLESSNQSKISALACAIEGFKTNFRSLQEDPAKNYPYIDEFISNSILDHLVLLYDHCHEENKLVIENILSDESTHLEKAHRVSTKHPEEKTAQEYKLYRHDLLNKYILSALSLPTRRSSLFERYGHIIGVVSAGIAMLIFFVLFIFQGEVFIINSAPFIAATVLLYVLKDRIKETIRSFSYSTFSKLISDYSTNIYTPDQSRVLGKVNEFFSYLNTNELPKEIQKVRQRAFHKVLEKFPRPETIMYYKRSVHLYRLKNEVITTRKALNLIFRLHIEKLLMKAEDPDHNNLQVDIKTHSTKNYILKKVYHINIILKVSELNSSHLQRFRIICTKNKILRVEEV